MKLLLDTHVVLWMLLDDPKLKPAVRHHLAAPDAQLYVSVVTPWEVAIKASLGRLEIDDEMQEPLTAFGVTFLGVELAHIACVRKLPLHHKDPFDRMLFAQALAEGMTLVSADRKAAAYEVPLLWA